MAMSGCRILKGTLSRILSISLNSQHMHLCRGCLNKCLSCRWPGWKHPRPQGYPVFLNATSRSNLPADQMDWRLWGRGWDGNGLQVDIFTKAKRFRLFPRVVTKLISMPWFVFSLRIKVISSFRLFKDVVVLELSRLLLILI